MDIFYVFTGNKPAALLDFLEPSGISPEKLLHLLETVYVQAYAVQRQNRTLSRMSANTCHTVSREAAFRQIQGQLSYLQYVSGDVGTDRNIFYRLRRHCEYTQGKMAGLLGIDIKKLRNLEKKRQFPNSELIWEMYHQFHVSPALILDDPMGLWNELNYVLGLLPEDDRDIMLQILESSYKLVNR